MNLMFHLTLGLYQITSKLLTPFFILLGRRRLKQKKELAEKIQERFGRPSFSCQKGPYVWLHGASIGEVRMAASLAYQILADHPDVWVLITSQTISAFKTMPTHNRIFHQMVPWDHPVWIKRFLNCWQPCCVFIFEAEIWPCLLYQTYKKKIPIHFLNFHLSDTSRKWWSWVPLFFKDLMSFCQSRTTGCCMSYDNYKKLIPLNNPPLIKKANLKYITQSLEPISPPQLEVWKQVLKERPFWLASCIHPEEQPLIFNLHQQLRRTKPDLLLICVPRHPLNLPPNPGVTYQSQNRLPQQDTTVYIVDTFGQLPLFYSLTSFCVFGGSFAPKGGHNPAEPAAYGCGVIHGPQTFNNQTLYDDLLHAQACIKVTLEEELTEIVMHFLDHPDESTAFGRRAKVVWETERSQAQTFLEEISALIPIKKK